MAHDVRYDEDEPTSGQLEAGRPPRQEGESTLAGIEHLVGVWLRRTANDDPRLADKLMNDVAAVVRGVPVSKRQLAEQRQAGTGEIEDGLARVLAFRFGMPKVDGEPGWFLLPERQKDEWRAEADMVRGYLVNAEGWRKP